MENLDKVTLESERLILKPIDLKYKEKIFQEFTHEITTFMCPKPAENIAETEEVIKNMIWQRQNKTDLVLVILKQKTFEYLGNCGIHQIDTNKPELGIWVKKSAHGCGFGKEAIHLLINWAKKNLEYEYFSYSVDKRNISSRKIPESLGGKVFREFQYTNMSGKILDLLEYRI